MEKPSKLLIPLAAAAALASADNANADGPASAWGPALMGWERGELSDSAKFCEKLRNAKGPDIKDYVVQFLPELEHPGVIRVIIAKQITTVMEDGQEVTLTCSYKTLKVDNDLDMPEGASTESFCKALFSLDESVMKKFTVSTPNATYTDKDMDGLPDDLQLVAPGAQEMYDATGIHKWDGTTCIDHSNNYGDPLLEISSPSDAAVCETLGAGLDDFYTGIAVGRRALGITTTEEMK